MSEPPSVQREVGHLFTSSPNRVETQSGVPRGPEVTLTSRHTLIGVTGGPRSGPSRVRGSTDLSPGCEENTDSWGKGTTDPGYVVFTVTLRVPTLEVVHEGAGSTGVSGREGGRRVLYPVVVPLFVPVVVPVVLPLVS